MQIPTPYLELAPSSAALSAITGDLMQLVFAVYLNHIRDICLPRQKNHRDKARFSLSVLTAVAKIIFFLFASHISTTSGDF